MKNQIEYLLYNDRIRQFVRFCIVGGIATVADAALFYLLRLWLPYQSSMMISYAICLCLNMVFTLLWTFNSTINVQNASSIIAAHLFNLFIVRFGLMALLVNVFQINDKLAFLPTLCISTLTNFFIIKVLLQRKTVQLHVFFLLLSAALVTLFSTCSPIYPINPWDDANVFMTIGKSMLHGMMPYRDLFDLKGILLFMVHEWAAFFFPHSFLGIYFLQIGCLFGFIVYSYKTMCLFCNSSITLPFTCLVALLTITSDFYYFGDSVEEFSLPIMAHSMYHFLLFVRDGKAPSRITGIIIGLGVGIILWMKYSILTFYFGALLAVLYLAYKRGEIAVVGMTLIQITGGIVIVTVPVLAYAYYHGILADFMDIYFYSNIFRYHGLETRGEMSWEEKVFPIIGYLILLGTISLVRVRKDIKIFVFFSFAGAACVLVLVKIPLCNIYYYLILSVFQPLFIRYIRNFRVSFKSVSAFALIAIVATLFNYNFMTLLNGYFTPRILEVAHIINKDNHEKDDVMLYRCKDRGIYVLTDCLPVIKHFFSVGVVYIPDEETTQAAYLESGKSKYVVTMDFVPDTLGYKQIYEGQDDLDRVFFASPLKYLSKLGYSRILLYFSVKAPQTRPTFLRLYKKV